jgi:hypothetical protein
MKSGAKIYSSNVCYDSAKEDNRLLVNREEEGFVD